MSVLKREGFYVWDIAIIVYLIIMVLTLIPVIKAVLSKVELHPGGDSFNDSPHFSDSGKFLLNQHYTRIRGTLGFWKNQAEKYKRFHYYCMYWTIPVSILVPILIQAANPGDSSKLLITIMSSHTAILFAFHRGFKVERNYKSFRHGESEFYDTYRRLLDRPYEFGEVESQQIDAYFKQVELIRKFVRNAETDNLPAIEDSRGEGVSAQRN